MKELQDEVLVGTQRPIDSNKKRSSDAIDEIHNVEENKLYVPQIIDTDHIIEEVTQIQAQIQQEIISLKDDPVNNPSLDV